MTEEVQNEVTQTTESEVAKQPEIQPEGTAPEGQEEAKQEEQKTFTQAELDDILQRRLAKEERRIQRKVEQQMREQVQVQNLSNEPRRESFVDDESFQKARIEHLSELKAIQKLKEREIFERQEKLTETFLEKSEKAIERYPDFQSVVSNPLLPINDSMAEFIAESEHGAEVAYFLGKNPIKASQIAHLSPVKASIELTRIEQELASKPQQKTTKAPPPINPVGVRGKSSSSSTPSDDDDIATWMAKEKKRLRG